VLLIGHAGHPRCSHHGPIAGGSVHLIETIDDALAFIPNDADALAYTTQTTLSVDDTRAIAEVLKGRFPRMVGRARRYLLCHDQPPGAVKRICPALRQPDRGRLAQQLELAPLVEVAERAGCPRAMLVQSASRSIGPTSSASRASALPPEPRRRRSGRGDHRAFKARFAAKVQSVVTAEEDIAFKLPRQLRVGPAL